MVAAGGLGAAGYAFADACVVRVEDQHVALLVPTAARAGTGPAVGDLLRPGFHVVNPMTSAAIDFDLSPRSQRSRIVASTADGAPVEATVAVTSALIEDRVANIHAQRAGGGADATDEVVVRELCRSVGQTSFEAARAADLTGPGRKQFEAGLHGAIQDAAAHYGVEVTTVKLEKVRVDKKRR